MAVESHTVNSWGAAKVPLRGNFVVMNIDVKFIVMSIFLKCVVASICIKFIVRSVCIVCSGDYLSVWWCGECLH